jgi:hypothetical protein
VKRHYLKQTASPGAIVRPRAVGVSRLATDDTQSGRRGRGREHAVDDVPGSGVGVRLAGRRQEHECENEAGDEPPDAGHATGACERRCAGQAPR